MSEENSSLKGQEETVVADAYLEPIPKLTIDMYEFTPNNDSAGKLNEG